MASLYEDLADLAMHAKGIRSHAEASQAFPAVLSGLRGAVARVRRLSPRFRRNPPAHESACWLYRIVADCPIDEDQRAEAGRLITELAELTGATPPEWRPAPVPPAKRKWTRQQGLSLGKTPS